MTLAVIPKAACATAAIEEVPVVIADLIRNHDALILERRGALTVGQDLMEANNKMEKLDHSALILLTALQLGKVELLPPREVDKILRLRMIERSRIP